MLWVYRPVAVCSSYTTPTAALPSPVQAGAYPDKRLGPAGSQRKVTWSLLPIAGHAGAGEE